MKKNCLEYVLNLICWPRKFIMFNVVYFYNNFRYLLSNVVLEYNERTRGRTRNFTPGNGPNLINVRAPR